MRNLPRTRFTGGSRSAPFTQGFHEWHLITFQFPVSLVQSLCSPISTEYFVVTATSVDIERVFSKGRLVLSHVHNRLSVQSTRALMCLGDWSKKGLVHDRDVLQVASLPDMKDTEEELEDGWDSLV